MSWAHSVKTMKDLEADAKRSWGRYVKSHRRQLAAARIPLNPDVVYAGKGWNGWSDWVGWGGATPGWKRK